MHNCNIKPYKKNSFSFLFVTLFLFNACIGEDFIDDFVEPSFKIDNPITGLQVSKTHNYSGTYLNTIGEPETTNISWSSSDETVISIDNTGLATAISPGDATISAQIISDGETISDDDTLSIVEEEIENNLEKPESRTGIIKTTSSYSLEGNFVITRSEGNLTITIADDYTASTSLPGLYVYLSNNPNSISGGLEIDAVTVFNGAHSYEIENVAITKYNYLLYWCKPFGVKVGQAKIN